MNLRHLAPQRRAVDLVIASATGPDGRLRTGDAVDALVTMITTSEDPVLHATVARNAAHKLLHDHGERFNPRRRRNAQGLYHPAYWLKLGDGVWVRMGFATQTDVNVWSTLSNTNRMQVDEADDERQHYAAPRLVIFRDNPDLTILHEVEQRSFDYQGSIHDVLDDTDDGFDGGREGLWIPGRPGR